MVKDISYYENKLGIIIYLLNSTDNEIIKEYLLDEYSRVYDVYFNTYCKEHNKHDETFTTMDWI